MKQTLLTWLLRLERGEGLRPSCLAPSVSLQVEPAAAECVVCSAVTKQWSWVEQLAVPAGKGSHGGESDTRHRHHMQTSLGRCHPLHKPHARQAVNLRLQAALFVQGAQASSVRHETADARIQEARVPEPAVHAGNVAAAAALLA